jgi:cellulose biosynthesis protein BcsQ
MPEPCRFDDSVPRMLTLLVSQLGRQLVENGVLLRDAAGTLAFFAAQPIEESRVRELSMALRTELGHYARPDRPLADSNAPGAPRVLADTAALVVSEDVEGVPLWFRYLDRRIVGSEWLHRPSPARDEAPASGPARAKRVVFCSLKGGVGRSTALSVVAAEQARQGRNILVVDLDLEAPGIGSLLLATDRTPTYGVVDYLVERNFWTPLTGSTTEDQHERDDLVRAMVGTCSLTSGAGLVDVVPATGTRTLEHPRNYLAKLSRAMIEGLADPDHPMPLAAKLNNMLTDLEGLRRYDFVFIDVRAGLAELAASPILALDAEVLLFGTAQAQTVQDLRFLFAHLATLTGDLRPSPWSRLKLVHAKASSLDRQAQFRDDLWDLFTTFLYEETADDNEDEFEVFNFAADAPEAPHVPIVIPLDTAFADWDPVHNPANMLSTYYARTFGDLITYVDDLLSVSEADAQD